MDNASREKRKELIAEIESKRKSKVITYITSDRPGLQYPILPDAVPIIHEHILALEEKEQKKLDLFLYSRGGASDVPWTIVSMFRQYAKKEKFSVLIPYRAHSGATAIALGADEIIMTKKAELGPIDITTVGDFNPKDENNNKLPIKVEDVMGYFSLLQKVGCERPDEKMRGFELLTKQVNALALGNVSRLLDETKLVASRLLNTRATPFTEEENHEIIKKISSEVYSHDHAINRDEARDYIGLKQVKDAEHDRVDIANQLWELYEQYRLLFEFENAFRPEQELATTNLAEKTWPNLNIACVESLNRFDVCTTDLRVRKILQQLPQQINVNLANVNIPAINISGLPQGIDEQSVYNLVRQIFNQTVSQYLANATQVVVQELIKSLPLKFERADLNLGWKLLDPNHGN